MKNYKKCRILLKKQLFNSLLDNFTKKIISKFTNEIDISTFAKILEENMNLIIQLATESDINVNEEYLVEKNVVIFEKNYKKYIEIIKEKISTTPD